MQLRVRTRVAGKLQFRVDSRSQTLAVPAGLDRADAAHAGHERPARAALAAPDAGQDEGEGAPLLALRLRRLVLVSPPSAG